MTAFDLQAILPELLLAVFAMAALLAAVYTGKDKATPLVTWATAGVMLALALFIGLGDVANGRAFGGLLIEDAYARFAQVGILVAAAAVLLAGQETLVRRGLGRFEYPLLIALATVGMMIMVSAGDLMTLYMGLELQSLSLYVVAAMRRDSVKSTEAGMKYFILGALSSGLLLYGASLTYGYAGTTGFDGILAAAASGEIGLGLLFGLTFVAAGLAFKVSAVPFHMWTPDVYEGAPTPVTAFFATAPKLAAMALFGRVLFDAFGHSVGDWSQIVALMAVLSMFLGAVAAIGQRDFKRLMAYSSIGHMGFALIGLASGSEYGVQAMLVYMAIYLTMNVGTFAFIMSMERDGKPVTEIAALNQYAKAEPVKALAMLVLLFSLAGVPPMVGFFGKLYVLNAAVQAEMTWLAVAGVVASVIGAFYYLRIVYYMYFGETEERLDTRMSAAGWVMLMGAAAAMLLGVINLFGVEGAAAQAAAALVN
ncbi:NADH-quinone oxidoreductase subunit NuoN [Maritimibacter sp. HL-12]|jgi:NADH-quinone oxidoreductase subunit N|uniref:NADH-quinone oxidoreductase subunit NuoN n=1 Tax=Maritimibacter sp. HL-12 TaxID=1162418 RepID=UPI000A0F3356|nr:NADH-quinone oxidoreductase subunit NuoN [Maritimibacter sp. HL-12]SMH29312.1 NADH dehydrogenase subunit N [Maritimibacter sp. HL-12]